METIAERIKSALERINNATNLAHRATDSVKLLAVSKTKPVSDIVLAYEAGQRMFGENYVQEGVEKIQSLQEFSDIEWHYIGPLQSNKSKLVAENFDWVQTIDRLKIAKRLNAQRSPHKKLNVLIQVNINQEQNKSGIAPLELVSLAEEINKMPNLTLRGLMTIPSAHQSERELSASFATMNDLFNQLKDRHSQIDTLSMGMSNDVEAAIIGGSTMVRIGTGIFGERVPVKNSAEKQQ